MNWISAKLKSFVEKAKNTFKRQRPSKDDQEKSLWTSCDCKNLIYKEDLESNFFDFDYQNINLNNVNNSIDKTILGLYLLTNCKHYVVTGSSFNWWGAWLGKQRNKIILRPSAQFFSDFYLNNKDFWPTNWIKIDA